MNPPKHTAERLDVDRMWAAAMRWIPVSESLPDDSKAVLIYVDGEPWTGYLESGEWSYICGDPLGGRVTHWMPFPDGPEEKQEAA